MVPWSPPAGRRVNLWQVSSLLHLWSVSVTLLTVPVSHWEDTLHRTTVTSLLMNTEEPRTSRRSQNGWEDSSGCHDHSLAGCGLKWSGTRLLDRECREKCHSTKTVIALMFEIHSMNPNMSLRGREQAAVYGKSERLCCKKGNIENSSRNNFLWLVWCSWLSLIPIQMNAVY